MCVCVCVCVLVCLRSEDTDSTRFLSMIAALRLCLRPLSVNGRVTGCMESVTERASTATVMAASTRVNGLMTRLYVLRHPPAPHPPHMRVSGPAYCADVSRSCVLCKEVSCLCTAGTLFCLHMDLNDLGSCFLRVTCLFAALHGDTRLLCPVDASLFMLSGVQVHGRGTCTYASGNRYEGEWVDGRIHGRFVSPTLSKLHSVLPFLCMRGCSVMVVEAKRPLVVFSEDEYDAVIKDMW